MPKKILKPIEGNSLITKFFTEKSNEAGEGPSSIAKEPEVPDFYESCVLGKVENCIPCSIQHAELKKKLADSLKKLNETQKAIDFCLEICSYKDQKIEQLRRKAQLASCEEIEQPKPIASKKTFSNFEDQFTEEQLSELRSVPSTESGDSTFVLKGVRYVYESNLSKLANKSVVGKSKDKEAITPEKLNLLKTMLDERLKTAEIDDVQQQKRAKRFNQHLNRAIINTNSLNKKMIDRQLVDKINIAYTENGNETSEQ